MPAGTVLQARRWRPGRCPKRTSDSSLVSFRLRPLLRWLDWLLVGLVFAALYAVREPQAVVIVAALMGQAIASVFTLPGPPKAEVVDDAD